MYRQYAEKVKNNMRASSNMLIDGIKAVSSNLYELDKPYKRYYDNEMLKPLPEISAALHGDFEFYSSPTASSNRTARRVPSRPEQPSIKLQIFLMLRTPDYYKESHSKSLGFSTDTEDQISYSKLYT